MFDEILCLVQVKRYAIVTCKHGIYVFPHELPNDLRTRNCANYELSGKCVKFIE